MASCGATTLTSRKKRRNTEIKEVKQKNRRNVTFTKRKQGLFHKLTELSLLCNVETALIITNTTKKGKLYSGGYPDADAVLRRYLAGGPPQRMNRACTTEQEETVEILRVEYEAVQNQLKEDRNRLQAMVESQKSDHSNPWWDLPIEDMSLDNLQHFKTSLENLKFNLIAAVQGKPLASSVPPMPSSMVYPMPYTTVPPQQWC